MKGSRLLSLQTRKHVHHAENNVTERGSVYQQLTGALQSRVIMQLKHIFAEIITSWPRSREKEKERDGERERESLLSAFRW